MGPHMMSDKLLPELLVAARYGVSKMTLKRWTDDPRLGFPKAIVIRKRLYRSADQLDQFDRRMAEAESEPPRNESISFVVALAVEGRRGEPLDQTRYVIAPSLKSWHVSRWHNCGVGRPRRYRSTPEPCDRGWTQRPGG